MAELIIEEKTVESVSDFMNCIHEDVFRKEHLLFAAGIKKYLTFLSNYVNVELIKEYCRSVAQKMMDYVHHRSMDEGFVNSFGKKLDEILNKKWCNNSVDEIASFFQRLISTDAQLNDIKKDFSDSDMLKVPGIVDVVFRGHGNSEWSLLPSIFRDPERLKKYEREIYHEMIMRAPDTFQEKDVFGNLVLMQHYSCPTRLLDVTFNPLVALYFACQKEEEKGVQKDGKLLVFVNVRCDFWNETSIQAQSKLALLDYGRKIEFWKDVFSGASLKKYEDVFTLEELDPIHFLAPLWAKTKNYAPRIERQSGAFTTVPEIGIKKDKDGRWISPLDFFCCKSYRIPESYKTDILKELNMMNINETSLFDGLEHVGKYLQTMYE